MHDVVRDFALNIAPKYNHQFMVKAGIGLREWTNIDTFEDFTCISLMSNNTIELPNELECPKLQVLMVQGSAKICFPGNFFQGMKNLNVLNLSGFRLFSLLDSVSFLSNLRTLYISDGELGDIGVIGKLSKLEILCLSESNIKEIPISFSQLSNLRLLDLNDCWELTLKSRGVIFSLKKLEELYINRFWEWESESEILKSNANLVELQALSRLTHLEISISNLDLSPKLLVFPNNLSKFKLRIGYIEYSNHFDEYLDGSRYSRYMCASQTNISKIHDCCWVKGLLKRTECLILKKIANLESISHNLVEDGFNELKYLDITLCDEIKYLLNAMEGTPNSTFHNLEELNIYCNPNLVELCHGQPPALSFSKLKVLKVTSCSNMLSVVPSHLLQSLQNFQTFKTYGCRSVVYIFDCKDIKIAEGETKLLSSLEHLELKELPELSHIWKGDHQSISLHNLKEVKIWSCSKLIKLFSPTLLQSLICLEEIDIAYCNNLEEIFEKKEALDEELDHIITSPSLGNLTSMYIENCHKLKNLFTPSIVKCLGKLKRLEL
ncbi:putative disease resistance protein At1g63350 isoform X1 [Pistacia vera]|uniref:putative disease resistance protein At1g63350 isoform X1 n=1 Tax=Pistacia vera TaxID=55513 RepID=UPI001262B00E|nr:putative disease resistance protein At1g63350 isoform X1 [Pistacia vera]